MKKQLLLLAMLLPMLASAHDIAIKKDGITIYYNYINDGKELAVIFRGDYYDSYSKEYWGNLVIPIEETINNKTYKVTSIGDYAFYGCSSLTSVTIPNSVTSIGGRAFSGCSRLTSFTILNSVTSIGNGAFQNCSGLTSVTLNSNAIVSKNYTSSSNLKNIFGSQVKEYILGEGVTSIGDWAFYDCSGLTSVTIPNSVTSIGNHAFQNCQTMKFVNIPNSVTYIGIFAFSSCRGIETIKLPNGITSIENTVFSGCVSLTSITIPNSVTSIGLAAFYGCSGLTSITIPNSVTNIGGSVFGRCSNLTSITIPNSVTSIGSSTFYECTGLTVVHISDISAWCKIDFADPLANPLSNAHHLYLNNEEIKELIIPKDVSSIKDRAFYGCSGLTCVTIPNNVTSIGQDVFNRCHSLISIIVESGNTQYDSRNNCNAIIETASNELLCGCKNTVIPNSVTSIGRGAFSGCSDLTSITIPNSVMSIGGNAFRWCSNLTSITIPNSVTSIGGNAFYQCSNLTSITIPNSVTSIGGNAFYQCSNLTSITIPNSVTTIGNSAFSGCSNLTSITIPNSVTSIGESAFFDCSGLTSVTIGSGVTSIGPNVFGGADITTIFSLIEKPFTIYEKTSDISTFTLNTFNNAMLYVPKGTKRKYKATNGWKDFAHIEEGNPTGINVVENTKNSHTNIYDLNGVRLPNPKKGINIVNGKKVVVK